MSLIPLKNLSTVSLTPVNSFLAVSLTPAINFRFFGYLWPVSTTPRKNVITGDNDTSDNCSPVSLIPVKNQRSYCHRRSLFTGVVDTGEKFIIGVVVTGDHFSAVSMTPVINLSPVSTTLPIKENPWRRLIACVNDTADKFVSGVVDTAEQFIAGVFDTADTVNIHSRLSRQIFDKSWNDPNGILRGPGYTDSWKKNWSRKSRVRLPLRSVSVLELNARESPG